ncbi:MAG: hypothetical protein LQ338_007603 [Usnochroma carphineum]|nr:MAG: hypothetical protein LQ338_007603 [Usnochroma carphineum]
MYLNSIIASAILATTALASPVSQPIAEPATGAPLEKRVTHYGIATFYEQNGAAGSCGQVHAESDYIIALSPSWQGSGYPPAYCGRKIQITNDGGGQSNNGKGKVVTATVADTCPGCDSNHLDLSHGAFQALTGGNLDPPGQFNIEWFVSFINL